MKFETLYTVAAMATSERLSQQTVLCNHERCAIACLGSILYVRSSESLNVRRRDQRCKTADVDKMQTQDFMIHTSLATIRHGKTVSYNILSPYHKMAVSSRGPHIQALDSATPSHSRRRGQIYSYSSPTNERILAVTPVHSFSWNRYPQRSDRDSIEFPGIQILDSRKNMEN